MKISTDLAYRIRFLRGLFLQDGEYEDERIKELVPTYIEAEKLVKEADDKLYQIYRESLLTNLQSEPNEWR